MVLSLITSLENQSPPDESSRDSEDDSPVDLRKRCVIDRQCLSDKRKATEKNQSNNFVLTSLLQKKSAHSLSVDDGHKDGNENGVEMSNHRKQKDYSELESRLRQPRPTTPEYLNSFRTKCDDSVSDKFDKESSFLADRLLMPAPLPLKLHPSQNPFAMKRQFSVKLQHLEEHCDDYKDAETAKSISFRSQRDGGAFRSVGNYDRNSETNERMGADDENSDCEKEPKEFVPNYRKFYSRCSKKAKNLDQRDNSRDMSDFVPDINSDSVTTEDEDIRLKVRNISILKRSSSCSLVFPHRIADDDASRLSLSGFPTDSDIGDTLESEDQRHGLKRRLTLPLRSSSAAPKNDLTLRCLLQAPPAEKRVRSLDLAASCENSLYANFDSLHSYLSHSEKGQTHHHQKGIFSDRRVMTPDDYLRAVNKYYLEVFHNFSGLPVLQRLLSDTSSKTTGGHRPSVSPDSPMSTSPGSESTTSGSTDSGVFSDLGAEDAGRKRVSRALTGKHVRSGTGASPSTLRTLRQMIEDRRKMKILCKT